jgi:hypothetical protein
MRCTLRPDVLPQPKAGESARRPNDDVATVWDIDAGAWRAFRYDSVVEWMTVEPGAAVLEVEGMVYACSGDAPDVVVRWRYDDVECEMTDDGWTVVLTRPTIGVTVIAGPLVESQSLAMFPEDFADLDISLYALIDLTKSAMLALAVRRAATASSNRSRLTERVAGRVERMTA